MFLCYILWAFSAFHIFVFSSEVVLTSSILVLALNIIDASWRVNSFMYLGSSSTFHLVFFSKYCVFVFPSQVFSIFFLEEIL